MTRALLALALALAACGGSAESYGERACHVRGVICDACRTACEATAPHCAPTAGGER